MILLFLLHSLEHVLDHQHELVELEGGREETEERDKNGQTGQRERRRGTWVELEGGREDEDTSYTEEEAHTNRLTRGERTL